MKQTLLGQYSFPSSLSFVFTILGLAEVTPKSNTSIYSEYLTTLSKQSSVVGCKYYHFLDEVKDQSF